MLLFFYISLYTTSGVLICSTVSFIILGDIPSTPGDLLSFILLILLTTTSGGTTNCPNLSPSDPLNFFLVEVTNLYLLA